MTLRFFNLHFFCSFNTLLNFYCETVSYRPIYIMFFKYGYQFLWATLGINTGRPGSDNLFGLLCGEVSRCFLPGVSALVAAMKLHTSPASPRQHRPTYLCISVCSCLLKLANHGLFCFVAFAQRKAYLKKVQCYKSKY